MNSELRAAIHGKGVSIAGLVGGFWYLEAPASTPYPYCVFSFVTNTISRDSVSKFEDFYLQINIYHNSGTGIEDIAKKIYDALDDSESSFSLASYIFDRIERQFSRPMIIDDVYLITTQYKIELTKR